MIFKMRKPTRLKEYDYSRNGYYYITMCTYNRGELFGNIKNDRVILNKYGKIVEKTWLEIPIHFPAVALDQYIIMPNHIHGIINNPVGDGHARPINKNIKNNNLSIIIGSFKSAVTKKINQLKDNSFKWQRSFHDYIIRNDKSLNNIRKYIKKNPAIWGADENNILNYKLAGGACPSPTG